MRYQVPVRMLFGRDDIDSVFLPVQENIKARKTSFQASNPLALGSGGPGTRSSNVQTPIGWLTGKLAGVGAR